MRGFQHSTYPRPVPLMPTTYAPGSPGKEAVMCARIAEGYQLHHPADARFEGDLLPSQWCQWAKQQKKLADEAATQRIFDKIKARKALQILGVEKILPLSSAAGG